MLRDKGIAKYDFIKLLKTFSKNDLREFDKFLRSPFFNNHSTLVRVFSELKKFHPDFDDKHLTRRNLFISAGRGDNFSDTVFRKYMSKLSILAQEYLQTVNLRENKIEAKLGIVHQLLVRNVSDLFEKKISQTGHELFLKTNITDDYFYQVHKLNSYKILSRNNSDKEGKKNIHHSESVRHLLTYFLLNASVSYNQLLTNFRSFRNSGEGRLIESVLKSLNLKDYIKRVSKTRAGNSRKELLMLKIISCDIDLNSEREGHIAYRKLRRLLTENRTQIADELAQIYFKRLISFSIIQFQKGNDDYVQDIYLTFRYMHENNLLIHKNLPLLHFNDIHAILFSAVQCREFDWANELLDWYRQNANGADTSDHYNYGRAYIQFSKEEYEDALNSLATIKSRDPLLATETYILRAKTFFELGYLDSAVSLADTFRHFIRNNSEMSGYFKTELYNSIRFYRRLVSLTLHPDARKSDELCREISSCRRLRFRSWLIEKTSGLSKRGSVAV